MAKVIDFRKSNVLLLKPRKMQSPLEDAVTELRTIPSGNGKDLARRAMLYAKQGDLRTAVNLYLAACDLEPRNHDYRLMLAQLYDIRGDEEAALYYFQEAMRLVPQEDRKVFVRNYLSQ